MKQNVLKFALLFICMLVAVPSVYAKDKKEKKEKKEFEWTWDKTLSGNESMDGYLQAVDSIWYKMQDTMLSKVGDAFKSESKKRNERIGIHAAGGV